MFEVKHQYSAILWDMYSLLFPSPEVGVSLEALSLKLLCLVKRFFQKKKKFIWNILLYKPADKVESKR